MHIYTAAYLTSTTETIKTTLIRKNRENRQIQMDKKNEIEESKQKPERIRLKSYEREKWLDRGIRK